MKEVVIYTTLICPYCVKAKQLLERKGVTYREIRIDKEPQMAEEVVRRSGLQTVPQIFIGEHHVGGCDDLYAIEAKGELDGLLASALSK